MEVYFQVNFDFKCHIAVEMMVNIGRKGYFANVTKLMLSKLSQKQTFPELDLELFRLLASDGPNGYV